jgi:dihydrofolate synthase/folylpolyglutamate synthase
VPFSRATRNRAGARAPSPHFSKEIRPGLNRVIRALDLLGHPEESFASLLVAGTNGKGSVCAMVASSLREAGYRTGLYTSPHLIHPRERVCVNGTPVSSHDWTWAASRVAEVSRKNKLALTEFEAQTLVGFLVFERAGVDLAVLEVGLGGRLDAVNAVAAPELCVITSIGLDHTEWLGPTVRHVYLEKRGIARRGTPLLQDLPSSLHRESQRFAAVSGVPSWTLGRHVLFKVLSENTKPLGQTIRVQLEGGSWGEVTVPFWGMHQARNGALAFAALELLDRQGWRLGKRAIQEGIARAQWPGRFDVVRTCPPVVLDGAHNPAAVRELVNAWKSSPWGQQRATLIFSCLKDKDVKSMAKALSSIVRRVIVTPLVSDRARPLEDLVRVWKNFCPTESATSFREAWRKVSPDSGSPVLVTGSLYLVGEALKKLGRKK